jgi:OmpA-OmpF porin, OOP family
MAFFLVPIIRKLYSVGLLLLSASATFLLIGCADTTVAQRRLDAIQRIIDEARKMGAYACAPRELAAATAHLELGERELLDGDPARATRYMERAEISARDAITVSSRPECAARSSVTNVQKPEEKRGVERVDTEQCGNLPGKEGAGGPVEGVCHVDEQPTRTVNEGVENACKDTDDRGNGPRDQNSCLQQKKEGKTEDNGADPCASESGISANSVCLEKYKNIEISSKAIRLKSQIVFNEQANIRSDSALILADVALFLANNPKISVEIQGHTDSVGNDSYNLELSQSRADAVRNYLIIRGISPSRLTARGYGETSPIESNQTSRGRAANRRIEIIRTDISVVKRAVQNE